jgi:antitoxin component YwqK of YwqJK toxin-antitoxin module
MPYDLNKHLLSLFFGLLVLNSGFAQSKRDSLVFNMYDGEHPAYIKEEIRFTRLITKTSVGLYQIKDYYLDGKLKLSATSNRGSIDFQPGTEGAYAEYFPNGKLKYARNYSDGWIAGDATTYYPNGKVYSVVNYIGEAYLLKTCKAASGKTLAKNGKGMWLKLDDTLGYVAEGPVLAGKENGKWKGINKDGKPDVAVYKNGKQVSGVKLEGSKVNQVYTAVEDQPHFGSAYNSFDIYIRQMLGIRNLPGGKA